MRGHQQLQLTKQLPAGVLNITSTMLERRDKAAQACVDLQQQQQQQHKG
jgi:hypothetical protein